MGILVCVPLKHLGQFRFHRRVGTGNHEANSKPADGASLAQHLFDSRIEVIDLRHL